MRLVKMVHFFNHEISEKNDTIEILEAEVKALEDDLSKQRYERYLHHQPRFDTHIATTNTSTPPTSMNATYFILYHGRRIHRPQSISSLVDEMFQHMYLSLVISFSMYYYFSYVVGRICKQFGNCLDFAMIINDHSINTFEKVV